MRKSSSLNSSCFILLLALVSCETSSPKSTGNDTLTTEKKDSINQNLKKASIPKDSADPIHESSAQGTSQSQELKPKNGVQKTGKTETTVVRIEHGSDNQAKLDSIKREKEKLKKL